MQGPVSRGKGVDRDAEQRRVAALRTHRAALVLLLLAALSTVWAIFLWNELNDARRTGAAPVCAFGDTACGALWDADFATWVHGTTGLPVAGWGVAWGLAAFLTSLALWLARLRGGRLERLDGDHEQASLPLHATWNGAVHVVAAIGAVSILVLAGASASAGMFCSSCAITYVTVLGFAAVCFFGLPSPGGSGLGQGFGVAALTTIAVALLLLVLGPTTPPKATDSLAGARVPSTSGAGPEGGVTDSSAAGPSAAPSSAAPAASPDASPDAGAPAARGPLSTDEQLRSFLESMPPEALQSISDTLEAYRQAPAVLLPPSRDLLGNVAAPVRLTLFTDTLCSHCADLHQTIEQLMMMAPGGFNVDSRQYPLDPGCNPHLGGQSGPPGVRCMAALVRICAESSEHRWEVESRLYANQRILDESNLYGFVVPPLERMLLDACIGADSTAASLAQDIEAAWQVRPHGTPIVLVNNKQALFYPPLLLSLILTGGDADHAAFAQLPAPQPLPDEHDGHAH